jgi:hypothetical protein
MDALNAASLCIVLAAAAVSFESTKNPSRLEWFRCMSTDWPLPLLLAAPLLLPPLPEPLPPLEPPLELPLDDPPLLLPPLVLPLPLPPLLPPLDPLLLLAPPLEPPLLPELLLPPAPELLPLLEHIVNVRNAKGMQTAPMRWIMGAPTSNKRTMGKMWGGVRSGVPNAQGL